MQVKDQEILRLLREVEDPEVPVSIVDLGIVRRCEFEGETVRVELAPTRAACPAREYIARQVEERLRRALGDRFRVRVEWLPSAAWSVADISPAGRSAFREYGIAIPESGPDGRRLVRCPYCGSADVRPILRFGTAVCRAAWYCGSCRNPFEEMRWGEAPAEG